MAFRINDEKLLEKCKSIWAKIEDLKDIELNALLVYDDRYIKTKIGAYGDHVYTNFCRINMPKNRMQCESFTAISIDSLLVYENKYYVQVYFDKCPYKIIGKKMIAYLDDNLFKTG